MLISEEKIQTDEDLPIYTKDIAENIENTEEEAEQDSAQRCNAP